MCVVCQSAHVPCAWCCATPISSRNRIKPVRCRLRLMTQTHPLPIRKGFWLSVTDVASATQCDSDGSDSCRVTSFFVYHSSLLTTRFSEQSQCSPKSSEMNQRNRHFFRGPSASQPSFFFSKKYVRVKMLWCILGCSDYQSKTWLRNVKRESIAFSIFRPNLA